MEKLHEKQISNDVTLSPSLVLCRFIEGNHTDEVDEELSDVFIYPWAPG